MSAVAKNDEAEREARAAAAETASVARAEAYEEAKKAQATAQKIDEAKRGAVAEAQNRWLEFSVNVWLTPFNRFEFGPWRHQRNKGKSRQFTSDMDIFAEVIENGETSGVIGYRKELWKDQSGTEKRLVCKLFSESLNWRASLDMMVGRSLQQTLGARGVPVTSYAINSADDDFLVILERSANKWPLLPENYSFFYMDGNSPRFYRLKRNLIDIGGDYKLIAPSGERVGFIDGALFTIGGHWSCGVRADHADPRVLTVMKLFASLISFKGEATRHIKRLARDLKHGRLDPTIKRQEADLYLNPRRIR
jgi:hypothetical protein